MFIFREINRYLRAYFRLADPHPLIFASSIISAIIYKVLAIIRPLVASLIIKALSEGDAHKTYLYIALYAGVYIIYRLALFLNYRAYSWNVSYTYRTMQSKVFKKLINVDGNFTRKISKGRLINTINSDLIDIGEIADDVSEFFTTIFQIVIILFITITYSLPLAILMFVSSCAYTVFRNQMDRKYNFYWWKTQATHDNYSNFLGQVLSGLSEVKTFNMLPELRKKLDKYQLSFDRSYKKQRHYSTRRDNDCDFIFYAFHTIIYIILIFLIMQGDATVDILVLLVAYHDEILDHTDALVEAMANIRVTNASVYRVSAILRYHSEKEVKFGNVALDNLAGKIAIKDVSLKLNGRQILKDINLKIKRHEFVAIVGFPGAGKTKLFDLLLRINQPTKGKIYLDDIDINNFSREVYTSNVAVANQTPFIFNMSIRKNLDFIDDDISHQIEACKIAGIHEFIETLPQGYNTILRENANNISGGQRQMISIARTILTNAEVLLLDDVTTSLDPDTAKLVPRLVKKLKDDRTIIMITKKPDLMKSADRIVVLDQGKISDIGTHEKLLERSSVYRALQAQKSEEVQNV